MDKEKQKKYSVEQARKEYDEAVKVARTNPHSKGAAAKLLRARKRLNQAYAGMAD